MSRLIALLCIGFFGFSSLHAGGCCPDDNKKSKDCCGNDNQKSKAACCKEEESTCGFERKCCAQLYCTLSSCDDEKERCECKCTMPITPMFYLTGAYTLWTAREGGLPVANGAYPFTDTSIDQFRHVTYPKWKLRSGFKVGFGVAWEYGGDFYIQYTWFYNLNNSSRCVRWETDDAPTNTWPALYPSGSGDGNQLLRGCSRWDNQFNRLELIWARMFEVGHYFFYKPFGGLLAWWDYQFLQANYTRANSPDPFIRGTESQSAWGVGVYVGSFTEYMFYNDCMNMFGVFLDFGFSLPWSTFKGKIGSSKDTTDVFSTEKVQAVGTYNNLTLTTMMFELTLGLRYTLLLRASMFMLQVGWESQVYTDHNHMYLFPLAPQGFGSQYYIMQGMTVKLFIGF